MADQQTLAGRILLSYLKDLNNKYVPNLGKSVQNGVSRAVIFENIEQISRAAKNDPGWSTALMDVSLNVEIVFLLSYNGVLDPIQYLENKSEDASYMEVYGEDLAKLVEDGSHDHHIKSLANKILQYSSSINFIENSFIQSFSRTIYLNSLCNDTTPCNLNELLYLSDIKIDNGFKKIVLQTILNLSLFDEGVSIFTAIADCNAVKPSDSVSLNTVYLTIIKYLTGTEVIEVLEKTFMDINEESKLLWRNLSLLVLTLYLEDKAAKLIFKSFTQRLLEESLNTKDKCKLYAVLLLGKMCTQESASGMSYLNWYSSVFSSESHRPLNTDQRANFFLSAMTEILDCEPVGYLKVYVHKAAFVPPSSQGVLSDYLLQAKGRLLSLNESTELGFFENVTSMGSAENDIQCLLNRFNTSGKIPQNFIASLSFRRQYYEKTFLPKLLSTCEGKSSSRHNVIEQLHGLGKISNALFLKHKEICQ